MIPDCDGRSDGQTDGQTESIIANTALCIARAMLTRCKNRVPRETDSSPADLNVDEEGGGLAADAVASSHENNVLKAAGRTKRTLTKRSGAPEVAASVRWTFR